MKLPNIDAQLSINDAHLSIFDIQLPINTMNLLNFDAQLPISNGELPTVEFSCL